MESGGYPERADQPLLAAVEAEQATCDGSQSLCSVGDKAPETLESTGTADSSRTPDSSPVGDKGPELLEKNGTVDSSRVDLGPDKLDSTEALDSSRTLDSSLVGDKGPELLESAGTLDSCRAADMGGPDKLESTGALDSSPALGSTLVDKGPKRLESAGTLDSSCAVDMSPERLESLGTLDSSRAVDALPDNLKSTGTTEILDSSRAQGSSLVGDISSEGLKRTGTGDSESIGTVGSFGTLVAKRQNSGSGVTFDGLWRSTSTSSLITVQADSATIRNPDDGEESIVHFTMQDDGTCILGNEGQEKARGKLSLDCRSISWGDDDVWHLRRSFLFGDDKFHPGQEVKVTMLGTLMEKDASGSSWLVALGDGNDAMVSVDEENLEQVDDEEADYLKQNSTMKKARHSKARAAATQAASAATAATQAATAATKVVTAQAVARVADAKKAVTVGAAAVGTGAAAAGKRAQKMHNWLRDRFTKNAAKQSQPEASDAKSSGDTGEEDKVGGLSKAGFIIDNPGKVHDFYDIEKKKLGEGSYASVSQCTNKSTGVARALKSVSKAQMTNLQRFKQEVAIMRVLDHPNIVKLVESFEDVRNIYLILELCTGGELFDRIIESGHFTEVQAAILMQQMFRAVFYMHENHICHRDLKPENFLFTNKDPVEKSLLKVIDFGLSCKFEDSQVLTTKAGTPYYVAPQVLAGKYDQSSDLWSLGVITYVLLCGYPPFYGETDAQVLSKVRLGNFSFNAADWKNRSDDAKNLIRMCLKMNPRDRYTAEQALNSPWIKNKAPNASAAPLPYLFDNLRGFRSQPKFKKAALHVIASQLGENQIKGLRETFMALDTNGDGLLSFQEMKEGLCRCGLKEIPPDLQQIMEEVDSDGSGVIDYTEFLAATIDRKVYILEDVCWQAFRIFDRNGDGKIYKDDIRQVLDNDDVQKLTERDLADIMGEIDQNGDGSIDFDEFVQMMRSGT